MKSYITNTLLCILAVALGGIFTWILDRYGMSPVISLEQWDTVATIFWSLLPFLLCLFLGVLVQAVVRLSPLVAAELETRSAMNDALMWQARHATKAQRKAL